MGKVVLDGKVWLAWDDDFHAKAKLAGTDQEGINKALTAGKLEAQKIDGVWHYAILGLNKCFPLPEGRGWGD